ncbi:hypothetical protein LCGC14_3071130, partial [marine sediment metagenome]
MEIETFEMVELDEKDVLIVGSQGTIAVCSKEYF